MGKKGKSGKARLDKYYHLAKEQGYRARSAFKLIQLTQKNDIFSRCRSLLDLCAAPGGWLQVAQKNMPLDSTIVGVDLAPIRPIRGVVCIQADITTQRCRNLLKQHLEAGGCDVVLHDGAPNVGTSWAHDAFAQNELVLHATKLASEYLRPGGSYITKVFRSKDYVSILWVLRQLFSHVNATKPLSSRNVSAEIFVICTGFRAPHKIDPKFFDPKSVFLTVESEGTHDPNEKVAGAPKKNLTELFKASLKKNRQGYSEGDDCRVSPIKDFILSSSPAEFLMKHHKFTFPEDCELTAALKAHKVTTPELIELCEDLKVLGKGELASLIKWRFKFRKALNELNAESRKMIADDTATGVEGDEGGEKPEEEDTKGHFGPSILDTEEFAVEREMEEVIAKVKKQELKAKRKLREKVNKLKLLKKMSLGTFDPGEMDEELFFLKGRKLLAEEDEVIAKYLAESPDRIVYEDSDEEEEVEDESEEGDEDSEADDGEDDERYERIARMAVDMEVLHEMDKALSGEKAEKAKLKAKKETRRQAAYASWAKELESFTEEMQAKVEKGMKSYDDYDGSSEDEGEDGVAEGVYRIVDDDGVGEQLNDDAVDDDELSSSNPLLEKHRSDWPVMPSNKKGSAARISVEQKRAEAKLEAQQAERWFGQDLFKAAGVSIDLVGKKEDRKIAENLDRPGDYIKELSDSEIPKLPLSEKQKRQEKRKRETEKRERKDARKKARNAATLGPLGVPVEDDVDAGHFEVVSESYVSPEATTAGLSDVKSSVQDGWEDEEEEEELDEETKRLDSLKPKNADDLAQLQAIGSLMCHKKSRMDLIDGAFHRYAFNDAEEDLPEWFVENEELHNKPELPVTKDLVREYRAKMKEISQRPIRKVLEAQGRKRMRLKKRMEKVKRQAESIAESNDQDEGAKRRAITRLKKKALKEGKTDKSYIVSKRVGGGKAMKPKGDASKSEYKVVDKRLKKDKRGVKNSARMKKRAAGKKR